MVLVAAAALGATIGETHSRFSSVATNEGNVLATAASFCAPSSQTVLADADSYVDETLAAQGSNFGTATRLDVRSALAADRRTLLRFPLPSIPDFCTVASATLRLHAASATSDRTLDAFRAAASWSETGVTWSNRPALGGTAATTASGTGWREWDVTVHVEAMYSGSNNGFVLRDASEDALVPASQELSSREGTNPPQLVLTFG